MKCAWQELLRILPPWLALEVDGQGRDTLQEIRLRQGLPAQLVFEGKSQWTSRRATGEDIRFCVNTASQYSPWAAGTIASGFLTAQGGHRIGVSGEAVVQDGIVTGIRNPSSLCIRVAREFPGVAAPLTDLDGSILLLGPPGSGKTTLLRDLICQLARRECVTVVDERWELFPKQEPGEKLQLDVLHGFPKGAGISMALRTLGPAAIAVDEITDEADCRALVESARCGVRLLATAHGAGWDDLKNRPVYKPLVEERLFEHIVILRRDKSWRRERVVR